MLCLLSQGPPIALDPLGNMFQDDVEFGGDREGDSSIERKEGGSQLTNDLLPFRIEVKAKDAIIYLLWSWRWNIKSRKIHPNP